MAPARKTKRAEEPAAVWMPVKDLLPWAENPRKNDAAVAEVAKSIKRFGFGSPILARSANREVIAGHTRILAAKSLGLDKVPVRLLNLDAADAHLLALADNKVGEIAEWDDAALGKVLAELKASGADVEASGFTAAEMSELWAAIDAEQYAGVEEDEVPEPPNNPESVVGEVYELGRHRLVCGDATTVGSWDALGIEPRSAVFTSPPYGAGNVAKLRDHYVPGAENRKSFYAGHDDDPSNWFDLMMGWTSIAVETTDCVVCNVQMLADNKRAMIKWMGAFADRLVDVAVWDKVNGAPQMQRNVMTNLFEWMFVLGGNGTRALPFGDFHGTVGNIVRIDPRSENNESASIHRAVMPVSLASWAISNILPTCASVVDCFGGTGTTLVAAEMAGKPARLIEKDPRYCDVIRTRYANLVAKVARG